MDNVTDIIKIVVGIVIVLGLAAIAFTLFNKGSDASDSAGQKIDDLTSSVDTRDYTKLEGRNDISGTSVQSFLSDHKDENRFIYVKTSKNTFYMNYAAGKSLAAAAGAACEGIADDTTNAKGKTAAFTVSANKLTSKDNGKIISAAKRTDSDIYVQPTATFTAELVYDTDETTIIGIVFTQN